MNSSSASAIGIDIGGTKIAMALVTAAGEILSKRSIATEAEQGFERAIHRMAESIDQLAAGANNRLVGIGIGCAGPVDPARGLINNPYTLTGWNQCDIVTPLAQRYQMPVWLENDADVAGVGEFSAGAAVNFNPVVMLTFGTGVGGATIIRGEIYRGQNGEHPELGHLVVVPDGPACYCGANGCLEGIASGTAIAAEGEKFGFDGARDVFAAAGKGNPAASRIIDSALRAATNAVWTICHTILPQCVVLGGGIMDDHFELFADSIKARLKLATQFTHKEVKILKACLGNDAGVVGAGFLALRRGLME